LDVRTALKSVGALTSALTLMVTVANADVVAVVAPTNPVAALSQQQVADIFLGKSSRFPNGDSATPVDQREGSAVRDEFYARFTGKSPAQIKAFWSKIIFTGRGRPPRAVANSAEAKKLLATNPHAIAYIERRDVDSSVKVVAADSS
jgi:ABC-type phosphate transport system substrate-binding protein